jgi:hypothetical protein
MLAAVTALVTRRSITASGGAPSGETVMCSAPLTVVVK